MSTELPPPSVRCPAPLARAPRVQGAHECLHPAPATLQGAVAAVICRDIRALALSDAQRLSHFPASPLVTLSCFQDFDVGLVHPGGGPSTWTPFGARCVLSGSQSHPTVSWAARSGRGAMVMFTADVAQALLGVDLAALHDRFVPAQEALAPALWPLLDALEGADDDAATLAALQRHLAPRWQAQRGRDATSPSLLQLGRHWLERLSLRARDWQGTRSPRQVERRVKAMSGRSLREWRALVRTEGLFFSARALHASGQPLDWAALAADEGFSDQAHLIRATRRITGFAPTEFAQRYAEDESFWLYRLWV